jgi:hypothetical protein
MITILITVLKLDPKIAVPLGALLDFILILILGEAIS